VNFVIYTPGWTYRSAGVRALHWLCHRINSLGHHAWIYPQPPANPKLNTPIVTSDTLCTVPRPYVAFYPEIVGKDEMGGDLVARWLLNHPGKASKDSSGEWSSSDLLFHWDGFEVPGAQRLCLPVIDRENFHNRDNPFDGKREGVWFYSSKASCHGVPEPTEYGQNMAAADIAPELLGWVLRRIKKLYVYETTTIALEAGLCGCEVEYVLSDYLPSVPAVQVEPSDEDADQMVLAMIKTCQEAMR